MDKCTLTVIKCELCGKEFNGYNPKSALSRHSIYCKDKYEFLKKYNLNENNIIEIYDECGSVLQFKNKFPFRENNKFYYDILKDFNAEISFKKAGNSINTKLKRKETNIEKYGYKHNFEKNCDSRIKWEKRLLNTEGITNVFQRKEVKKKSIETNLLKYGVEYAAQNEDFKINRKYCILKYGETEGIEKYKEICYNRGKSTRLEYFIKKYGNIDGPIKYLDRQKNFLCSKNGCISKLNIIFSDMLKSLNIEFESEFSIPYNDSYKKYDFKIGNNLIELNGDFWHANPKTYYSDDILSFPGGKVTAKDIWEKDKLKKDIAINNGYNILYFWENEINNKYKFEKIKLKIKKLCNL